LVKPAAATDPKALPVVRCHWARNEWNIPYHDQEWGIPVHDDHKWFEFLILEGAQAGLSWDTILRKRPHYREVFDGFDPEKVARYGAKKVKALLSDPGIIRNRLKVAAAIENAKRIQALQKEHGSFAAWLAGALAVMLALLLTMGVDGISAYLTQLQQPLPTGADNLTLHGALAATGTFALVLRVLIVGAVLGAAYKLRSSPGLVVPLAIVGSLIVSPYLHGSDLCLLAAAAWMVWEERPALTWRVPLAAGWVLASPYLYLKGMSPELKLWPWLALVIAAWWPLTAWADWRTRAPA